MESEKIAIQSEKNKVCSTCNKLLNLIEYQTYTKNLKKYYFNDCNNCLNIKFFRSHIKLIID